MHISNSCDLYIFAVDVCTSTHVSMRTLSVRCVLVNMWSVVVGILNILAIMGRLAIFSADADRLWSLSYTFLCAEIVCACTLEDVCLSQLWPCRCDGIFCGPCMSQMKFCLDSAVHQHGDSKSSHWRHRTQLTLQLVYEQWRHSRENASEYREVIVAVSRAFVCVYRRRANPSPFVGDLVWW